jgi:hypothetical protein
VPDDFGVRTVELAEQDPAVPEQRPSDGGRLDRPMAPGLPLEQLPVDDALERRDLLRDARLRVAEPFRGSGERALVDDGDERDEQTDLEGRPALAPAGRSLRGNQHKRTYWGPL